MNYDDGTYQKSKFSNSTKYIKSISTSNYISTSKVMFSSIYENKQRNLWDIGNILVDFLETYLVYCFINRLYFLVIEYITKLNK